MAIMAVQPAWLAPPSRYPSARRTSFVERIIRKDVSAVANEENATPARMRLVVGTTCPTLARL